MSNAVSGNILRMRLAFKRKRTPEELASVDKFDVKYNPFYLTIDGRRAETTKVYGRKKPFFVPVKDLDVQKLIQEATLLQLPVAARFLLPASSRVLPGLELVVSPEKRLLEFHIAINVVGWKGEWTIADYYEALREVATHTALHIDGDAENIPIGSIVVITPELPPSTVNEAVHSWQPLVESLHSEATVRLANATQVSSVTTRFDFPEPVKVACEQYLLYFGEFLRDLGIDATTEIKEASAGVMFAVTPSDPRDALQRIREALGIYLRLPASPLANESSGIEAQRLAANVHHLRGQLALARAVMCAQQTTIEAQRLTIDIQSQITSGDVVLSSVKPEDKERLLGGTLALTQFRGKGVEINLAELFRKLRSAFRK